MEVFRLLGVVALNRGEVEEDLTAVEQKAEESAGKMQGSFSRIGDAVKKLVGPAGIAAIGAAFVAMGKTGLDNVRAIEDATRQYQIATGASAEEAERFSDTIQSLHKVNTDSYEDLSAAVTKLRQRHGDLGDETEETTQIFLDYAKVTGQDTAQAIDQLSDVMLRFNIPLEEAGQLTDKLKATSQETGIPVRELQSALESSGTQLTAMGYSLDESVAMLGAFHQAGVDAGTSTRALNSFMNNTKDLSEDQALALHRLGAELDFVHTASSDTAKAAEEHGIQLREGQTLSEEMRRELSGLGIEYETSATLAGTQKDALADMFGALADGEPTVEQMQAAMSIFGTRAGPEMLQALSSGQMGIDDLTAAIEGSTGTVATASEIYDQQLGERWQLIRRQYLEPFMEVLGVYLLNIINHLLDVLEVWGPRIAAIFEVMSTAIQAVVSFVGGLIEGVFGGVADDTEDSMSSMSETVTSVLQTLQELVELIGSAIAAFWDEWGEDIVAFTQAAFGTLFDIISSVLGYVQGTIENVLTIIEGVLNVFIGAFTGDWAQMQEGLLQIWQGLWGQVENIIETVVGVISAIFGDLPERLIQGAKDMAVGVANWFQAMLDRNVERVEELIAGVLSIFDVSALVNRAKDMAVGVAEWFTALRDRNIERVQGLWAGIAKALNPLTILEAIQEGFRDALEYLMHAVPKAFIEGGINIINAFIEGLMAAARRIPLVGGQIANFLSDYLIGESPPRKGPLRNIRVGGRRVVESWADGLHDGIPEVEYAGHQLAKSFKEPLGDIEKGVEELNENIVSGTVKASQKMLTTWSATWAQMMLRLRSFVEESTEVLEGYSESISEIWEMAIENILTAAGRLMSEVFWMFEGHSDWVDEYEEETGRLPSVWERVSERVSRIVGGMGDAIRLTMGTVFAELSTGFLKAAIASGSFGEAFQKTFVAAAASMWDFLKEQGRWLLGVMANAVKAVSAFLGQAFSALTTFFWFLGPAAPIAAGAVIGSALAAIAALGLRVAKSISQRSASVPDRDDDHDLPGDSDRDFDIDPDRPGRVGRQISEITGPTRDFLVDILSPLARLDTLTGIGERIYDLLDERLPHDMAMAGAGVHIENLNVYAASTSPEDIADASIDVVEEALAIRYEERERGAGQR